jgi:GSCFA family
MNSPYESLPREAFWRTGVVGQRPDAIPGLYKKKFPITRSARVATAGSCFAQHIARNLRARNYSVIDAEPAPPGLDEKTAAEFGYGIYSARYANVYTARQMLQIVQEAFGEFKPADAVWQARDRFYDAMRPSVEPHGLPNADAVLDHRDYHLGKIREVITGADVFVFTLGLTETWVHAPSGTVYPTAPGTIAGHYDPEIHCFRNFGFLEVYNDLSAFFNLIVSVNPKVNFLLTVSPVPLTATASGEHVLAATVYSKSVLRAVAGQLYHERKNVDYFPSYEIITSTLSKGAYFEANLRSIAMEGVDAAMSAFFAEHGEDEVDVNPPVALRQEIEGEDEDNEVVCEEILLDAFSR